MLQTEDQALAVAIACLPARRARAELVAADCKSTSEVWRCRCPLATISIDFTIIRPNVPAERLGRVGGVRRQARLGPRGSDFVGTKKTGKGRRKIGRKKRRMRSRIRHRKK